VCGRPRHEKPPRSGRTTAGRAARAEGDPLRQPWDNDSGEPPDTPPTWVRWTTGTGLIVIAVVLLIPYASWSRLAVLAAVVVAVSMLYRTDET
jgi:hypothetical protein